MRLQPVAVAAVAALLLGAPAALAQTTPDSTPPTAPSSPWAEAVGATPGLAAWWRLDEREGTVAADRAGDNDGAYAPGVRLGATGLIAGDPDTAIALDARGEAYVDAGDVLDFPGFAPFTVEAWIAPGEFQSPYPRILQKDGVDENGNRQGYLVYLNKETGKLGFERWRDGEADVVTTPDPIAIDRPIHVAATYDGSTMRLFLDGALVAEGAAQRDLSDNAFGLRLGARSDGESPFFGILDEVAVYGAALDADTVAAHYAAGTSGGTVELPPFDPDAAATPAADAVPPAEPIIAEEPAETAIAEQPAETAVPEEPASADPPAADATPAVPVAQPTDAPPADQTIIGPPAPTASPAAAAEATQPAVVEIAPAETPAAETPAPAATERPAVATVAPAETPEPAAPAPTPAPATIAATTTEEVNFRAGPTTDTVIIATLPAGTPVEATGKIVDDFVQVVFEGRTGWIFADYLVYPEA